MFCPQLIPILLVLVAGTALGFSLWVAIVLPCCLTCLWLRGVVVLNASTCSDRIPCGLGAAAWLCLGPALLTNRLVADVARGFSPWVATCLLPKPFVSRWVFDVDVVFVLGIFMLFFVFVLFAFFGVSCNGCV